MKFRNLLRRANLVSIGLEKASDYFAFCDASEEYRDRIYSGWEEVFALATQVLAHPLGGKRISNVWVKYDSTHFDDW
jgi:hypothetical protein